MLFFSQRLNWVHQFSLIFDFYSNSTTNEIGAYKSNKVSPNLAYFIFQNYFFLKYFSASLNKLIRKKIKPNWFQSKKIVLGKSLTCHQPKLVNTKTNDDWWSLIDQIELKKWPFYAGAKNGCGWPSQTAFSKISKSENDFLLWNPGTR